MIIKNITKFTVIGLLAIGLSSPALAVPVFNAFYGTDLVADPNDSGGQLRKYNFTVSYESCIDSGASGDPCGGAYFDLSTFNLVFPFDDVIIASDPYAFEPLGNPDLYLFDAYLDPSGFATATIDWIGALGNPLLGFGFSILVDFGQAMFPTGVPEFDFYTGDPAYPDPLQLGVVAEFDASLGGETIPQVPEPGTLALFGLGLLGMGAAKRRKM